MSVIVNITHEIGDLSEYTSTVTDGGDLSVESAAALVGTKGLQCVIDDTTAIYGAKTGLNNTSGKARARFYFNPKTLAMGSGEKLLLLVLANAAVNAAAMVWVIYASSAYKIYAQLITDVPTAISTANYTITDALHYIEIYLQRAATNVSSDGSLQLWIDGVDKETITDRDNYDKFAQLAQTSFGSVAAAGAGTSGTFFLDAQVVNDDGGLIGPAGPTYTLAMDQGSFALTGQDVGLIASRLLAMDYGSFSLTGQDVTLLVSRLLSMDQGTYSLTGQDVGLFAARLLTIDQGFYTLTGQDVGLIVSRLLAMDQGSYALTGQDVNLLAARLLAMDQGSYTLTGQDANLIVSRLLTMGQGTYTLTGYDIDFYIFGYITALNHIALVIPRDKRADIPFRDKRDKRS